MREIFSETFFSYWQYIKSLTPKLIVALAIIISFFIVAKFLQRFYERRMRALGKFTIMVGFMSSLLKTFIMFLGVAIALKVLGFESVSSTLFAGAGISAVVFGFAFKDIAENFLAGIILAINRPFKIRDIIEVSGYKGKVREMDMRSTQIRVDDGRDIYIPNSMIIKNVFTNYTKDGLLQRSFFISISAKDNINQAIQVINSIILQQADVLKEPQAAVNIIESSAMAFKIKVSFWQNTFQNIPINDVVGDSTSSRLQRKIVKELSQLSIQTPI